MTPKKAALKTAAKISWRETVVEAVIKKVRFDIDEAMVRLRKAVEPYPPAALFQLAEEGFSSAFEQLLACIISIRTLDETTIESAHRLFARARTPAELYALDVSEIDSLIHPSTFHEAKARQMREIANLVLGIACKVPRVSVDVHVHRVTNRWGYVHTRTPEQTMMALEEKLPKEYWIEINRLLVPFGKHICTATRPRCSTCLLLDMCQQVGVTNPR